MLRAACRRRIMTSVLMRDMAHHAAPVTSCGLYPSCEFERIYLYPSTFDGMISWTAL